eukprot:scaffold91633_cov51-Phaeocystis_antarctica.AAC.1
MSSSAATPPAPLPCVNREVWGCPWRGRGAGLGAPVGRRRCRRRFDSSARGSAECSRPRRMLRENRERPPA